MIRSLYIFRTSIVALLATLAVCLSGVALADWAPKKPVDFVIMAGKGGGADKMARLMQSVIEQHGFRRNRLCQLTNPVALAPKH